VSLDDSLRRAAEQDCHRLITAYAIAADTHDLDLFIGVFAPNARWVRPNGTAIEGHEALRAFFVERPRSVLSRHVASNALVDVLGPDEARGISYATVYKQDGHMGGEAPLTGAQSIVEYHDSFVRTPAGWKITLRRSVSVLRRN